MAGVYTGHFLYKQSGNNAGELAAQEKMIVRLQFYYQVSVL